MLAVLLCQSGKRLRPWHKKETICWSFFTSEKGKLKNRTECLFWRQWRKWLNGRLVELAILNQSPGSATPDCIFSVLRQDIGFTKYLRVHFKSLVILCMTCRIYPTQEVRLQWYWRYNFGKLFSKASNACRRFVFRSSFTFANCTLISGSNIE